MAETRWHQASPPDSVAPSAPHRIVVCTPCTHKDRPCRPGLALLQRLRAAIGAAGLGAGFEVSGTACLAGCAPAEGASCLVGWRATAGATWLFGDIDPDQSLDDLVALSRQEEGRMSGPDLPPRRDQTRIARIPAAIIVTREGVLQ